MTTDSQNKCQLKPLGDDLAFQEFAAGHQGGVLMVAELRDDPATKVMAQDASDFVKWARHAAPDVKIHLGESDCRSVLCSADIWLPLAFIAHDVGLPLYLNLVSSYIYDRMKGALKGDGNRVHLSAVYKDQKKGVVKQFIFEGDRAALEKAIKRLDLDEFFE